MSNETVWREAEMIRTGLRPSRSDRKMQHKIPAISMALVPRVTLKGLTVLRAWTNKVPY